jgi:hypothetical protein
LIEKKAKIHRRKIPKFQVALTVVRARTPHPDKKDVVVREACTAFELQVPVDQRRAMEELLKKTFLGSTAKDLQFIHYVERHVHLDVFYRAVQMQRCHEESYRVVAVEGIHPEEWFVFERTLCKLKAYFQLQNPTFTTIMVNRLGDTIFCARNQIFPSWQRNFTKNLPVFIINTCKMKKRNFGKIITQSELHPDFHDRTIHRARFTQWIVEIHFSHIRHLSSTSVKSIGNTASTSPQW